MSTDILKDIDERSYVGIVANYMRLDGEWHEQVRAYLCTAIGADGTITRDTLMDLEAQYGLRHPEAMNAVERARTDYTIAQAWMQDRKVTAEEDRIDLERKLLAGRAR